MNRERALAALNGQLLREFSRRTTAALRGALPLRLALSALEPFLEENVAKEVRKDALVIQCAGEALAAGAPPGAGAARQLLAAARVIDREFLARVEGFAARIDIRYDRIEPLRLRRIELCLDTADRILDAWRHGRRLRDALSAGDVERRMFGMMRLYAEETRALSQSIRLPGLLAPVRERIALRLLEVMTGAARGLARDVARMGRHETRATTRQ